MSVTAPTSYRMYIHHPPPSHSAYSLMLSCVQLLLLYIREHNIYHIICANSVSSIGCISPYESIRCANISSAPERSCQVYNSSGHCTLPPISLGSLAPTLLDDHKPKWATGMVGWISPWKPNLSPWTWKPLGCGIGWTTL